MNLDFTFSEILPSVLLPIIAHEDKHQLLNLYSVLTLLGTTHDFWSTEINRVSVHADLALFPLPDTVANSFG